MGGRSDPAIGSAAMAHPRKFRFGVQLSTASSGDEWAAMAREVEDLGFSTLFLPDHFGDQLAPVPAMMAGLRVAVVSTIALATVAALVIPEGLGYPIFLALREAFKTEILAAGALAIGLALVADGLLVLLQRALTPWARVRRTA